MCQCHVPKQNVQLFCSVEEKLNVRVWWQSDLKGTIQYYIGPLVTLDLLWIKPDVERQIKKYCKLGPRCSKPTASSVNDLLKFISCDIQIYWNFWMKKCEQLLHFKSYSQCFSKTNSTTSDINSAKTVNEMTLNKFIKLTRLWITGPSLLSEQNFFSCILSSKW